MEREGRGDRSDMVPPDGDPAPARTRELGRSVQHRSCTWRAVIADDDVGRIWLDVVATGQPRVDDSDWEPIEVPGHWRATPAFAETAGPLLYRTRFEHDRPVAEDRAWLVL